MTAAFRPDLVTVDRLDLADAAACARVETWLVETDDATAFHRPAWTRAIEQGCRQRGHYLVAHLGTRIAGVLPLTEVRSALFGHALVSAGFAVGGGAIGTPGAIVRLIEAAAALGDRLGCATLELRGGHLPSAPRWTITDDAHAGFVRALAADDAAELLAIPRKQRAEVRRGLALGLDIATGNDAAARAAHHHAYATSVRNLGTPVFPRALFDAVLNEFGSDADILTVGQSGRTIASVLSLYHRGTVMPYWGGGTGEARALRANDVMYFALMRHARERGCTRFDFGRSKRDTGAFAFKKNWGFVPQPLAYATRCAEGAEPRVVNPLSPRYRLQIALWRRLPLVVANRVGPLIARGLG
jgi:FemAB-related protein (PEP-CTERM system-associated)